MPKPKYYAVRVGRDGPKIYDSWMQTDAAVRRYPYAQHKSFLSIQEAQQWLDDFLLKPPSPKLTEGKLLKRLYSKVEDDEEKVQTTSDQDPTPDYKRQRISSPLVKTNSDLNLNTPSSSYEHSLHINNNVTSDIKLPSNMELSNNNKDQPLIQSDSNPLSSTRVDLDFTPSNLSSDQAKVFQRVLNGRSVFFTGSAGTGKSYLLKLIIKHLRENFYKNVFITASTGIAASLIKGTTLHSFAGLGLAKDEIPKLIGKLRCSKHAIKRWLSVQVLVIDEVSMIDGNFFEKLNVIAKSIRRSTSPFGGIQLILTGDFFQLPPVTKPGFLRIPYIFETKTWDECINEMLVLKQVFRQSDQDFVDILNEIRYGIVSSRTIQIMKSLTKTVHYSDGIQPAELYPTQVEVQSANQLHLSKLTSPEVIFESWDRPGIETNYDAKTLLDILNKNTLVSQRLILKVGAQVMLVKNSPDDGLVNGSLGKITGFVDPQQLESFEEDNFARIDWCKFENDHKGWPKVLFTNGKTKVFKTHDFNVEDASGKILATRVQLPLILAWALSIHKSQGQSLDRVKIDLAKSFESGQVYVALSRATSLRSIQVLGFHKSKVKAQPEVLEWAKKYLD